MKYFQVLLIILLSYTIHAQSTLLKKQFTLKMSNAKVEDILGKIEELIEYHFSYEGNLFINEKRKSINLQDKSLENALKVILGNKYNYSILNNSIIIRKNKNYRPNRIKKRSNYKTKLNNRTKSNNNLEKSSSLINPIKLLKINKLKNTNLALGSQTIKKEIKQPVTFNVARKRMMLKLGYTISLLKNLQMISKKKIGISTGVALDFSMFKKLSFSTGFSFYKHNLLDNNFDINNLNNTNVENLDESIPRNYNSNLYMIDMSILARLNFNEKINTFFITAGLSNSYVNIKYDYYYNHNKVKYGKYYKLGLFNMINLSCGFEGKFNSVNNFSYQIEPFLKSSLTRFSPEKINIAYLGLSFRVNYYLKNQ